MIQTLAIVALRVATLMSEIPEGWPALFYCLLMVSVYERDHL